MIQQIKAPISVISKYDHHKRVTEPAKIKWDGKEYHIKKIGLHHTYWQGRILHHVFSVASQTVFFRIVLNTQNLQWTLEEVSDGEAS